jgi:hypothetical protein
MAVIGDAINLTAKRRRKSKAGSFTDLNDWQVCGPSVRAGK